MKKLLVGLLLLAFMLGFVSGFWSRPVLANTGSERRVMHCIAWPWSDDFPGASNPSHPNSSGSSNVENPGEMRNVQKNPTADRTDSRELKQKPANRNHFHHILYAFWEVIFPESF